MEERKSLETGIARAAMICSSPETQDADAVVTRSPMMMLVHAWEHHHEVVEPKSPAIGTALHVMICSLLEMLLAVAAENRSPMLHSVDSVHPEERAIREGLEIGTALSAATCAMAPGTLAVAAALPSHKQEADLVASEEMASEERASVVVASEVARTVEKARHQKKAIGTAPIVVIFSLLEMMSAASVVLHLVAPASEAVHEEVLR